ncbi:hypothetical protein KQI89_02260 [Clostridium sp. MSJ-4]|uniref:Uncharacterized protein n=1 Tax=Clostridium simiarum TaxID=2841506 RepID=A0ABS6EWH4_9CLOT|nr:hypothetical protein [Clostridium simiarum]MBU5590578.1 hypothetical protein [Clostridium simiarum]
MFLQTIYNDGYESEIIKEINISDIAFFDTYGDNTKDENRNFQKNFWDRLFSCDNIDELSETPKIFTE